MRAVAELEEGESHRTSHKAEAEAGSEAQAGQSVALTVEVEADSEGEAVLPEKRGIDTLLGGSGAASAAPADDAAGAAAAAASCVGGKGPESARGRVTAFCNQMRQRVPRTPLANWLGRAFAKGLRDKEPKARRLLGPVSPNLGRISAESRPNLGDLGESRRLLATPRLIRLGRCRRGVCSGAASRG